MIMSEENEQQYVEIYDNDGEIVKCEVFDIVDFEEKTYALLLPIEEEGEEEAEVIVMQYVEEGDDCYFQTIDDEDEFQRVCEYIQSLEDEEE